MPKPIKHSMIFLCPVVALGLGLGQQAPVAIDSLPPARSAVTASPPRSPGTAASPAPTRTAKAAVPASTPVSQPWAASAEDGSSSAGFVSASSTHLVIYLSQRQVALYAGKTRIKTYPIAVGRPGWETPTGQFRVVTMKQHPTWINPFTDQPIPGGAPDNPLGDYWIGFWTDGRNWIGLHGTPDTESVGRAASHGCIRMKNQDIGELFYQVTTGTPIVVKQ